jgi:hypothetical protein
LGHNVRAICWIVPQKYLLLLDQPILLHFRSSIDRPLDGYLPPYPPQSCTRKIFYQIIKINKTQILLKYFFLVSRGVTFLEKRRENVQIFQAFRWRFDIWEAIFNVRAICWIVPQKYLLLLDQPILLHFRSSIDRPLNGYLPPYPCSNNYFIKINKTQILLKYFFLVSRDVTFLEKRRENVQIFQAFRWRFDIWEAIFAVKNNGMSARNSYIQIYLPPYPCSNNYFSIPEENI